jgi:hypothetical protein
VTNEFQEIQLGSVLEEFESNCAAALVAAVAVAAVAAVAVAAAFAAEVGLHYPEQVDHCQ